MGFSVEEVVLACRSLQRIAEQVEDTEETGQCFHDVIIPRLLSLALQAALQGERRFLIPHPPAQHQVSLEESDGTQLVFNCDLTLFAGEGSSGRSSPLVEELVLSALLPVISTSCSRLQPKSVQPLCCSFLCFLLKEDLKKTSAAPSPLCQTLQVIL